MQWLLVVEHSMQCQLSVTVRVPPAFPLRNVEVDLGKTLGIAEKRWRRWSLNIMMMLNNQDGSILGEYFCRTLYLLHHK